MGNQNDEIFLSVNNNERFFAICQVSQISPSAAFIQRDVRNEGAFFLITCHEMKAIFILEMFNCFMYMLFVAQQQ